MISIIIPFKNSEKWLARCLESCKSQRSEDLEFVLVADNDIKDKSWEIAREYELSDKRFKLFYNQEDDGVSGARNTGICWANGEWIGFLDSDDELCPEYASKFRIVLREYNDHFNIYQFNTYRIYDGVREIPNMKYANDGGLYDVQNGFDNMPKEWCMVWNKIYSARFLKDNNIAFENFVQFGEDELFNIECYKHDTRICHAKRPCGLIYRHLCNKHSLSHIKGREDLRNLNMKIEKSLSQAKEDYMIEFLCDLLGQHWSSDCYKNVFKGSK